MSEEVSLSYRFSKTRKIVHYWPLVLDGILQPAIFPWVLIFVFSLDITALLAAERLVAAERSFKR